MSTALVSPERVENDLVQPTCTDIPVDDAQLVAFQKQISEWIRDLYHDTDTNGYLLKEPKSLCAKKTKQLVEYTISKSQELSTIRLHRRKTQLLTRASYKKFLYFFSETFFPVCVSILVAYLFFRSSFSQPSLDQPNQSYAYPENYEALGWISKTKHTLAASWTTFSLNSASEKTGGVLGNILYSIINVLSVTLEKGTGFSITRGVSILYYGLISATLAFCVYRLTLPMTLIFTNFRITEERQQSLKILEDEFIIEFERMIERSIYLLLQPSIMKTFEQLMYISAKTASVDSKQQTMRLISTFSQEYSILYMTLLQPLEQHVRKMELSEVLLMSQPSATFSNTMFRLIREANDDLAIQLNSLNRSLLDIPQAMRESLMRPVQSSIDTLQPIVTTLIARNM